MRFTVFEKDGQTAIAAEGEELALMVQDWEYLYQIEAPGAILTSKGWMIDTPEGLLPLLDAEAKGHCVAINHETAAEPQKELTDEELYEALGDSDANAERD